MSVIDLQPVRVNCLYNYPSQLIFKAWVDQKLIPKWLFNGPTSKIVHVELDLKKDGRFSILEFDEAKKEYIDHFGMYQYIDKPRRLVFTLSVPKHFEGETLVTIEIIPSGSGCELTLTQIGVAKETTEKEWKDMLENLKAVLENPSNNLPAEK